MLKNKIIGKKIRNIVILLMAIIVMIGAYRYIDRSRAENVIEVDAIALDNYGYLEDEEFKLEAKQLDDGLYEIELPESVNTKKINQIVKIGDGLEIIENRIYLTKEQIENGKINIEVEYDVVIAEDRTLYSKILKYEDTENGKLVELKGYLPVDAELQVKEVSQEQLTEIFGDKKIKVAYDIKILQKVITEVPADEAAPDAKPTQIVETIEINPEDYGEKCEVTIKDVSIAENSEVYHVKEDNTYEQVNVKENTEGNVSFEAQSFSVYAITDGEIEPDPGEETGAAWLTWIKLQQPGESSYEQYPLSDNGATLSITVPYGTLFGGMNCTGHGSTTLNGSIWGEKCIYCNRSKSVPSVGYMLDVGTWRFSAVDDINASGSNVAQVKVVRPPEFTVSPTNCNWRNSSLTVTLKVTAYAGWPSTDNNSYQYFVSTSATSLSGGSWTNYTKDVNNNITLGGTTGTYYIFVKRVIDSQSSYSIISSTNAYATNVTVNSTVYHRFGPYKFDYEKPTPATLNMRLGSSSGSAYSNNTWTNQSVYISLNNDASDGHSGVKTSTYTVKKDGAAYSSNQTAAQTLSTEGTYTVTVTTTDNAGNTKTSGTYTIKIDKTKPTITVDTTSCSWRNSALSVKITTADTGGSGLASSNTYQYFLSTSTSPTSKPTAASLSGTYTSGTAISLDPGTSGTYYLFIKRINDNAGNTSTTNGTATTVNSTTYQRFGPYYFDYTLPVAGTIGASTLYTNQPNVTIYLTGVSDAHSGVDNVTVNGWTGGSWNGSHKTIVATYDSTYDAYYAIHTFADMPNTSTGATNQGEGTYVIDAWVHDKAGNDANPGAVYVIYDITAPTWSTSNFAVDKANNKVTVDIIGADALSGVTTEGASLTKDAITVYVDGEKADSITKELSTVTTTDGGIKYTLTLTNWEEATKQTGKNYKEWSGQTSIVINAETMTDRAGNLSEEQELTLGYVDLIKPEFTYEDSNTIIGNGNKTYTMTFDVTDKYYTSGQLALDDLTILMQNGQYQRDASGNYVLDENGNKIPQIYDLNQLSTEGKINIAFNAVDKTATFNKTVDGTVTNGTYTIGHTYTLTISNLEQLAIKEGNTTLDYSGIITVAVSGNVVKDNGPSGNGTNPNGNVGTTITSGISVSGGTTSGTETTVDVVDPVWTKVSSSITTTETTIGATLTIRGTDTYWSTSTLTSANIDNAIKVIVNGSEFTTGITRNLVSTTELKEDRILNGVNTSNVKYGEEYTITITGEGSLSDVNQIKIQIPKGVLVDQSGNDSELEEFIVYNVLKSADSETEATSAFLGESVETTLYPQNPTSVTPIARQDIEKVVFLNDITGYDFSGIQRVWDVSAQGDASILAGTTNTTAPYTVYIISEAEIFANQNSRNLFRNIGYSESCTATATITNLNLLNISKATNMESMFYKCGYNAMTSLNLGNNFDTSNVEWMGYMFYECGHKAMTSLDLGDKFDTSNVKSMAGMFRVCGAYNMTSLDLGDKFNTSSVTDMQYMFGGCGYAKMTSLNLGDKFDTSNVTNMKSMFNSCGQLEMTTLVLGNNFNTNKVQNMSAMFQNCGQEKLTSLDLGDLFYTIEVTDMTNMFNGCGATAMTVLDLGPLFTSLAEQHDNFITGCGASDIIIYAPESIYSNKTAFKIGQ